MDWSKAKTILIIALVFTNLFLAAFLYGGNEAKTQSASPELMEEAEKILLRKDIKLDAKFPETTNSAYNLIVEYENILPEALNKSFFKDQGIIESTTALTEIYKGDESIVIINDKLIIYENETKAIGTSVADVESAVALALTFMEEKGYETDDMKLSFSQETEDGFYLDFTKSLEDFYIEHSFTTFRIKDGEIRKMERTWLNIKEIKDTNYPIISAQKMILELISMEDTFGKTITDISLSYYFDPEKQDYLGEYQQAMEGNAVPAWRVQFEDGYDVILELD
ncbi:MAG: two-component system regulatory protein YycI [Gudongella sp.]|nr:two-component system regulatory protein YycI [Gudongella sp.]